MNGGAAAALTAAIGSELVQMIASLNDVRLKRSSGSAQKALALQKKFKALVAEDSKAFAAIKKAYKYRAKKPGVLQAALKKGAQPPLRICGHCAEAGALIKKEAPRTSHWLEGDRKEAKILITAAFASANLSVEANLRMIDDRGFRNSIRKKVKAWQRSL